jgi:hypothetical protein
MLLSSQRVLVEPVIGRPSLARKRRADMKTNSRKRR